MAWPCALAALAALAYFFAWLHHLHPLSKSFPDLYSCSMSSSIEHAAHVTGMLQVRMLKFLETKAAGA
jgi:hypothetical protein